MNCFGEVLELDIERYFIHPSRHSHFQQFDRDGDYE